MGMRSEQLPSGQKGKYNPEGSFFSYFFDDALDHERGGQKDSEAYIWFFVAFHDLLFRKVEKKMFVIIVGNSVILP